MISLGIDPDLHHTGWALVSIGVCGTLTLLAAGSIRIPTKETGEMAEILMIYALAGALPEICREWCPDVIVVESQRIYPHSKSRPNDILRLARIAGACASVCANEHNTLFLPPPQMGKSIPKDVLQARAQAKLSKPIESLAMWSDIRASERPHALDALTFAVWGLTEAK